MINYHSFIERNKGTNLEKLTEMLPAYLEEGLSINRYGDLPQWLEALNALPEITPSVVDLGNTVSIGQKVDATPLQHSQLQQSLKALIPWRKGPISVFNELINTEWRSDWKWDRLKSKIEPLEGKTVLDVGCGNGYHCLRMSGMGAKEVVGIDPSPRFIVQFYMLKKYLANIAVDILPTTLEALPNNMEAFDTTFSMGVLYHRRSPMDHLRQLKETLLPNGQLVLETLVIDGVMGETLVPEGRYAMMNNVWFLPSIKTLESWLRKCGFKAVETIDITDTSRDEQRATEWMTFQSLSDFLDPKDATKTIEGHPAPKRAIILARK